MRPVFRALLLIGLLADVASFGQTNVQDKKQQLHHLPPGVTVIAGPPVIACDLSAASVQPGQSVQVTTRIVSGDPSGLKYSFESSAGKLITSGVNASTARLDTSSVSAFGINVTCVVVDTFERRITAAKTVHLGSGALAGAVLPLQHLPTAPKPPPPISKAEVPEVAHVTLTPPPPPPPTPTPTAVVPTNSGSSPPVEAAKAAKPTKPTIPANETKTPEETVNKEYAEGLAIQKWEKGLKTGKIEYNLPTRMSLPEATTVSAVVHGYEDVSGPVPSGSQAAALKVSQRMRVELSAEDPNEFKIEPDGTEDVQLVPIDGTARWQWKVTPKKPSASEKLTIRALLVYPDDPKKAEVELKPSYTAEVSVQVGSLWEWVKYLFWNDPVGLLKYLLPGGAGFAFVAGLVAWWWKRRNPDKKDKE